MEWIDLGTVGTEGSENGIILMDEEYNEACRITLEKCERYYAITCGVYGSMVHTVFCSPDDYQEKYTAMKDELKEFIDKETSEEEREAFYDSFTRKYW